MQLHSGTLLQGGKYIIERMLGQGGFGITYLAIQRGLNRKVAVKEFFMKELCERDEQTSRVTIGTQGSRDTVNRFREKFLKEARNIANLDHPNIVSVIDVFEENGTAYYVMKYVENGSLEAVVKRQGRLSEKMATRYILQIADALAYIHQRKMNHLDVKPGNIMLNSKNDAVLIDFGLSKQYDALTGGQTSTTPVGISYGYAPMEQYKEGGVSEFSPQSDVYSLGATFFKLLTGETPPSAFDINEHGFPVDRLKSCGISRSAIDVVSKAMRCRKKDRPCDVRYFSRNLSSIGEKDDEQAVAVDIGCTPRHNPSEETVVVGEDKNSKWYVNRRVLLGVFVPLILIFSVWAYNFIKPSGDRNKEQPEYASPDGLPIEVNGVTFNMIKVEGGTFTMGATSEQEDPESVEKQTHSVTLSAYYIGESEVTQSLWQAVTGSNPSKFKGGNLPVEQVSWDACQNFIKKLNEMTGRTFRLPTEAEWEFAARGGNKSKHTRYSGSKDIDDVAWYDGNSGNKTHPVKGKKANELGIYDMSGNVWEWCQDFYGDYGCTSQTNPTGPDSGTYRVNRGGCWSSYAGFCCSSIRSGNTPVSSSFNLGLRLVLSE